MRIGSFLASEEYSPRALTEQAKQAERAGCHALWISDHYHPWNDEQRHSGFATTSPDPFREWAPEILRRFQ